MPLSLNEEVHKIGNILAPKLFEQSHRILPVYFITCGDGRVIATPPFPEGVSMEAEMRIIRMLVQKLHAIRCVRLNEVWMAVHSKGQTEEMDKEFDDVLSGVKRVRDMPGRIEAVNISGEDVKSGTIIAYRKIIRTDADNPTLGKLEFLECEGGVFSGRAIGFFGSEGETKN